MSARQSGGPGNTRRRIQRSVRPIEQFPRFPITPPGAAKTCESRIGSLSRGQVGQPLKRSSISWSFRSARSTGAYKLLQRPLRSFVRTAGGGCDLALRTRPARMGESECWLLSSPFLQIVGLQTFDAAALKFGSGWLVFRVGMAAFPPSGCCETADCCGLDGVSRPDFHVPNIRAFHRNMRSLCRSACAD